MILKKQSIKIIGIILILIISTCFQLPVIANEDPLIMGGVPPSSTHQVTIQDFTDLATYLTIKLGAEITLKTSNEFAILWQSIKSKNNDIVHFYQYHSVKLYKKYDHVVNTENEAISQLLWTIKNISFPEVSFKLQSFLINLPDNKHNNQKSIIVSNFVIGKNF